jgi:hypothetical protein
LGGGFVGAPDNTIKSQKAKKKKKKKKGKKKKPIQIKLKNIKLVV